MRTAPDFAQIAALPPSHRKAAALREALEYYGFWAGFYGLEVKVDVSRMIEMPPSRVVDPRDIPPRGDPSDRHRGGY